MSSFTFADNRLGGRFTAAADAIAAGKLRTAAGILLELGNELNVEAESTDGLMAEEPEEAVEWPVKQSLRESTASPIDAPALLNRTAELLTPPTPAQPADLQMCARNVHAFGEPDYRGWRTCTACGSVNVAPPDA